MRKSNIIISWTDHSQLQRLVDSARLDRRVPRQSLDVPQAFVGVALLTVAMLGLSYLRTDLFPRWWQARRDTKAG